MNMSVLFHPEVGLKGFTAINLREWQRWAQHIPVGGMSMKGPVRNGPWTAAQTWRPTKEVGNSGNAFLGHLFTLCPIPAISIHSY
jgi:hypothetical protein